jgi:hypothetical protein
VDAAVSTWDGQTEMLHCLIRYVEIADDVVGTFDRGTRSSPFANVVEWFSFGNVTEGLVKTWQVPRRLSSHCLFPGVTVSLSFRRLMRVRRYLFDGSLNYLQLDKTATRLLFSTDKPFKIVFDSDGILEDLDEERNKEADARPEAPKVPAFFWMQGVEDVAIWVPLPEGTTKRDLKVTLKASEIYVKVGDVEKINGKLW